MLALNQLIRLVYMFPCDREVSEWVLLLVPVRENVIFLLNVRKLRWNWVDGLEREKEHLSLPHCCIPWITPGYSFNQTISPDPLYAYGSRSDEDRSLSLEKRWEDASGRDCNEHSAVTSPVPMTTQIWLKDEICKRQMLDVKAIHGSGVISLKQQTDTLCRLHSSKINTFRAFTGAHSPPGTCEKCWVGWRRASNLPNSRAPPYTSSSDVKVRPDSYHTILLTALTSMRRWHV